MQILICYINYFAMLPGHSYLNLHLLHEFFLLITFVYTVVSRNTTSTAVYSLLAFSNGVDLLFFKELLEANKKYIKYLFVTLNGPKQIHDKTRILNDGSGSFDYTVEGINTLISLKIPVWLSVI